MRDTPVRIANRFCEQLFVGRHSDQIADLELYFERGGSVCALARKGIAGLVSEYGLEREDAQALALRLNGLATWVLRRFIEEQLTRREPIPAHVRQGLLALVNGPSYSQLFVPKFDQKCPSDALEAIHSPVAYAVWLKHWSEQRLTPSEPGEAYRLTTRRPDLDKLRIDPVTANGVVTSVEVVSAVLEKSITDSLGEIANLNETLSRRRYPNGLPYHHPWTTLDEMTRDLDMSVGRVVELCDPQAPYFLRALPWGNTSDHVLTQAARLSPSLRQVMTEDRHFPSEDSDQYYRENFGLLGDIEPQNLNQSYFFNQRTKLTQSRLEALLSVELFASTVSEHAPVFGEMPVTPGHVGSVFINDGLTAPSMAMDYRAIEQLHRISETSHDRFDRLNRKIRLDNALQLPSHETDALLSAIIGAEATPDTLSKGVPKEKEFSYWMTGNTLRALGLFQMLKENYQCSAEEFAAFIGSVSIFGRGTELSQFDRVFNRDTLSTSPLLLDDGAFALVPATEADALTIAQICGGLNIDLATYFNLAQLIANALGLTALKRSLPVLSSFYRMARLPQILGIAPNVAVEILNLSSADWAVALIGEPRINANTQTQAPDVLTEILRLEGWVRWCADSDLDVAWTIEHLQPIADASEPSEAQTRLFEQISTQLAPALFTEAALQMAGVPPLSNGRQWTNQLLDLADWDGLVIHRAESADRSYEDYARTVVEFVVLQAIGRQDPQIVEQIMGVLLSSRSGQHSVVQESLAVYGELTSSLALPILSWSGGTVYDVLVHVLGRTPTGDSSRANQREEAPGDPFLSMLGGFAYRSEVVKGLKLSTEFLTLYLSIGDGVERPGAAGSFTPSVLYYLSVYNRAVALSQKPESRLLDYWQLVNELPNDLSSDGLRLVQDHTAELLAELFDWSAEEVRACADRVNAGPGYIRSLVHLDVLTRLRAFALQSKLDASTTLKIGALHPDAPFYEYATLAEQAAALLAEQRRTSPLYGIHAVNDRVVVECTATGTELIANSPQTTSVTIKVSRAQVGQKNVNVYWSSTLCRVEPPISPTDAEGTATVTVHAGTTTGNDLISYRLDAREPQPGVTITLSNDPSTFEFAPLDNEIYVTEEKVGVDITLRALLQDRYGNPATNERVYWSLEPLFETPPTSLVNVDGVAEFTFTSLEPLEIEKPKVWNDNGGLLFRPIEFTD